MASLHAPPRCLDIQMHYFVDGSDPDLPPSLSSVISSLPANEFLIRGNLNSTQYISAPVYNPGTGLDEQFYDAYNIISGDWLANQATGYAWKIIQLFTVSDSPNPGNDTSSGVFYAIMKDIDDFNAGMDSTGSYNGGPAFVDSQTLLFTLDEKGFPILTPADTFNLSPNFSTAVFSRFRALNTYEKFISVYQLNAGTTFSIGDPVYIDPSDGLFKKSQGIGDISGVYQTIGIVTSVNIPTTDNFTFQPFGQYYPSATFSSFTGTTFTGAAGTIYYIDPSGTNQYTSIKPPLNPYPVFQLIDGTGNAVLLASGGGGGAGPASGTGPTGFTGPTGPTGSIGFTGSAGSTGPTGDIAKYIFDGGDPFTTFEVGPAFNAGNVGFTGYVGPSGQIVNGTNIQLQLRHGLAVDWATVNPTLAIGELGYETDSALFKIGDGVTDWNNLPYGGLQGATGTTGVQGPTGTTGVQGPTGMTGPLFDSSSMSANQVYFQGPGGPTGTNLFTFDPLSGPSGEVKIQGKLTVEGIIDPIGLYLTPTNQYTPSYTGLLWLSTTGGLYYGTTLVAEGPTGNPNSVITGGGISGTGPTGPGYTGPTGPTGAAGGAGGVGETGSTGPTGSFGASSDQFLSLTRTNDASATSALFDCFQSATGANNVEAAGISFSPSTGSFTVSTPGTYLIHGVLIIDALSGSPEIINAKIRRNGSDIWSYNIGVHQVVDPNPVNIQIYQTLDSGDTINLLLDANSGNITLKAGSTLNITRLSVGPTGATGAGSTGETGATGFVGPTGFTGQTGPIFTGGILTFIDMTGPAYLKQFSEAIQSITGATSVVTHDWTSSAIFYHSSMSANFTANVTNLPSTSQRSYTVSLLLNQGANAYYASALQVGGSAQTIHWANGVTPVPLANKKEIETFTLVNTSQTVTPSWLIFGDYGTYG